MDPTLRDMPPPVYSARYATPPPPQSRRPHLEFPPPPPYPPPDSSPDIEDEDINDVFPARSSTPSPPETCLNNSSGIPLKNMEGFYSEKRLDKCMLPVSLKTPQSKRTPVLPLPDHVDDGREVNEYSYAYYESGAASTLPDQHPEHCLSSEGRMNRHTYTTHYGTEENIYEEIGEVATLHGAMNQSFLEEEVRRVQSRHHRVLGELNLTVEAMLAPLEEDNGACLDACEGRLNGRPDLLEDLLQSVGPTDELLSPAEFDSGFSGSSGGTNYNSLRRFSHPRAACSFPRSVTPLVGYAHLPCADTAPRRLETKLPGGATGFWSRKGWRKFSAFNSVKHEPRARTGSWDETGLHHASSQRRLDPSQRTVSSEESWYSGSDQELSSGEESERSGANSTKTNGQLRSTLNKARTLCDKWRGGGGGGGVARLPSEDLSSAPGRLSRWFSIRRGSANQYDVDSGDRAANSGKMPLLPEVDEEYATTFANMSCMFKRRQLPPSLPPAPLGLTPQQIKRRHIVAAIVHSENSYVATLQRLVNDYKKPLEESSPPILSSSKLCTLFHRLPEILQCHTLFRIALAESVRAWDREEKLGDVFVASFSKAIVLDIYSGFINNFSLAMDLAKTESKRKSALADFLKVKQISAHDRLSFFGLMVKPVQRFPQFILFLQDLLKYTPQGHHDRMSLQLALTQLESLAEMLNERKREAEQFQAFKETLRRLSGKFTARPLSDANRYLLREDDVTQLEFNQSGLITKSKPRRLLLLNDLVVCVSVSPRSSDDFGSSERLGLKWTFPVSDIEVVDTSASPTLSRLLTAGLNRGSSLRSNHSADSAVGADNLCAEMSDLMHDYEVVSRISDLVSSLRGSYKELSVEGTRRILDSIQGSIQHKDEEMAWVDSCCLQLAVRGKSNKEEVFTFQTDNPGVKKEWITELRLAQLALDPSNSPAWEVPEQERRPSTKMPLFVKAQPVYRSQHETEVRCGCYYGCSTTKPGSSRKPTGYLWVCTTDGASSHIAILAQHQQQAGQLRDVGAFDLVETKVTAMEYVRGAGPGGLTADTVWMGTDSRRIVIYSALEPEKQEQLGSTAVPGVVVQIRSHCDSVFVALGCGSLLQYRRGLDGCWNLAEPSSLSLGTEPVSCLLPINAGLYAACGLKVWVLGGHSGQIQKSFSVQHEGTVNLMAHSGVGLWVSLRSSSTVCLYHTETFRHLQDINVASNVGRVASTTPGGRPTVCVTALLACKGLLWVGTDAGICLTIPLPRLEGVPIISGRVNISYHAHFGPISFLLALQPRGGTPYFPRLPGDQRLEVPPVLDELSPTPTDSPAPRPSRHSPVVLRRKSRERGVPDRGSKTLPRGLGGSRLSASTTSSQGSGECDVYGLYGELMFVRDYEGEGPAAGESEPLRRSDPELAAIPGKVSTLDRRLRLRAGRPRSLDLSNWSVDSRASSACTSSGSEEALARLATRTVEEEEAIPQKASPKSPGGDVTRRTVITLMGGRGYVDWRRGSDKGRPPNCVDAHIVMWEMKL